jgi:hypothetical protein
VFLHQFEQKQMSDDSISKGNITPSNVKADDDVNAVAAAIMLVDWQLGHCECCKYFSPLHDTYVICNIPTSCTYYDWWILVAWLRLVAWQLGCSA